jgi:hypothetical protein
MLSLFALQANAEQTKHEVYVMRTNPSIGTKLHRSSMMLPTVELVYDTEVNTIDIVCSYNCDADVTVSDEMGNIVAISDINDTIILPSSNLSFYSVTIEAEYWYGIVEISL